MARWKDRMKLNFQLFAGYCWLFQMDGIAATPNLRSITKQHINHGSSAFIQLETTVDLMIFHWIHQECHLWSCIRSQIAINRGKLPWIAMNCNRIIPCPTGDPLLRRAEPGMSPRNFSEAQRRRSLRCPHSWIVHFMDNPWMDDDWG